MGFILVKRCGGKRCASTAPTAFYCSFCALWRPFTERKFADGGNGQRSCLAARRIPARALCGTVRRGGTKSRAEIPLPGNSWPGGEFPHLQGFVHNGGELGRNHAEPTGLSAAPTNGRGHKIELTNPPVFPAPVRPRNASMWNEPRRRMRGQRIPTRTTGKQRVPSGRKSRGRKNVHGVSARPFQRRLG